MRKIKITALVLAVLMVMAAFAGCAGKADFEDLRQDFEDHINQSNQNQADLAEQNKAQDDKINDILDALDKLGTTIESNNQAQKDAIDNLTNTVNGLKENLDKVDQANKDNAATEQANTALQNKKNAALSVLTSITTSCDANKNDYSKADYDAILAAVAAAEDKIEKATTADAVDAALAEANKVFNELATIPARLEVYYNSILNKITISSADLIAEIDVYLNGKIVDGKLEKSPVQTQYNFEYDADRRISDGDAEIKGKIPASILEYDTGKTNEAGLKVTVNLINELQDAIDAYAFLIDTVVDMVDTAIDTIKSIGTIYVTFDAQGVPTHERYVEAMAMYDRVVNEVKGVIGMEAGEYVEFLADDENLALVTNYATLQAADAKIKNLQAAFTAYGANKEIGRADAKYDFFDLFRYEDATVAVNPVAQNYRADFTLKAKVYDVIDAWLKNWIDTYKLGDDFVNVAILINRYEDETWAWDGTSTNFTKDDKTATHYDARFGFYGEYLFFTARVAKLYQSYLDFAKIEAKITATNSIMNLKAANVKSFEDLAAEIATWLKNVDQYNFAKVIDAYELNYIDAGIDAKTGETINAFDAQYAVACDRLDHTVVCDLNKCTGDDFKFPGENSDVDGAGLPSYDIIYTNQLGINDNKEAEAIQPKHYTVQYNFVALFRFANDTVRGYIEDDTVYFTAKAQSDAFEAAIQTLADGEAWKNNLRPATSVLPLVNLDGSYKKLDVQAADAESTWKKRTDEEIADLNAPATYIQSWYATWTTNSYDFSPMFDQAAFDSVWKTIEDRIAAQKTDYATKILSLVSGLTVGKANLSHEAKIDEAEVLYKDGIKFNRLTSLREMVKDENDPRYVTFPLIIVEERQNSLEGMIDKMDKLNAQLNALNTFYVNISKAADWGYKTGEVRSILTLNNKASWTETSGSSTKTYYLKADGTKTETKADGLSEIALLQAVETDYLEFMDANGNETSSDKAKALIALRETFRVHNYMALSLLVHNAWLEVSKCTVDKTTGGSTDVEFMYAYITLDYVAGYETAELKNLLKNLNWAIGEAGADEVKGWNIEAISLVEGSVFAVDSTEKNLLNNSTK